MRKNSLCFFAFISFMILVDKGFAQGGGGGAGAGAGGGAASSAGNLPTSGALTPTMVKFGAGYHLYQGIPFDYPTLFQFPLDKRINVNTIMYIPLEKSTYKKFSNGGNQPGSGQFDYAGFFQAAFAYAAKKKAYYFIQLGHADTLTKNTDPAGTKFLLTTSHPVYLDGNKQYLFLVLHSFYDDADRYAKMNAVLLPLIDVFKNHVVNGDYSNGDPVGTAITTLLNVRHDDRIGNSRAWDMYSAWALNNPQEAGILNGFALSYTALFNSFYKTLYYEPIPDASQLVPPIARPAGSSPAISNSYSLYQVGAYTARSLDSCLNDLHNIQVNAFPDFSNEDCFSGLIGRASSCGKCVQGACSDCGYLADNTGFLNFLADLRVSQAGQSQIAVFATQLGVHLASETFILNDDDLDIEAAISRYNGYLKLLDSLLIHEDAVNCPDRCGATMKVKVTAALDVLTNLKKKYDRVLQFRAFYKDVLDSNAFWSAVLFGGDSYLYSATTRVNLRLTSDLGVVDYGLSRYSHDFARIVPYFGVQVNFQYVQPDIPFSDLRDANWRSLKRLSWFLGITTFSVKEAGKIDNLFGNNTALTGFGYKITPAWRFVAGAVGVKIINPNPIITSTRFGAMAFAGFSFDSNSILTSIINMVK